MPYRFPVGPQQQQMMMNPAFHEYSDQAMLMQNRSPATDSNTPLARDGAFASVRYVK
jgi:hypothetical protein